MSSLLWRLKNEAIETIAGWAGRQVYGRTALWLADRSWYDRFAKYIEIDRAGRLPATRILDRRFTLINFCEPARRLQGSTAECGVFKGVGSALICKVLEGTYAAGERHYGFDSFEGLSQPVDRDHQGAKFHLWKAGDLTASLEDTQKNLSDFPLCQLHKGWIPACFEPARNDRFRFVHIDVDLHDPTRDCLEFFYPRMVDGGIFLFDDYGSAACPGARKAIDEFFASREPVIDLASGQGFVTRRLR